MLAAILAVAVAAEAPTVEEVAVKNRLFTTEGRFELGLTAGIGVLSRLTQHYTFDATIAYNLPQSFAVELLAGYTYAEQTETAKKLIMMRAGSATRMVDDLTDLWQMSANGVLGLRWQPLYGKLSIFGEPLHFQIYGWAGGGAALFDRTSIVFSGLTEQRVGWVASFALGARFFLPLLGDHHAIRLEVRDFSWLDVYRVKAAAGMPDTGTTTTGITSMVQAHLGYAFLF